MRIILAAFVLLANLSSTLFARPGPPGELRFQHLGRQQGLANSTVPAIYQDSRGFMWFGTYDGLNKYDGNHFTVYHSVLGDNQNLSSDWLFAIGESSDGMLWLGTAGGGLNQFDPRTETFTQFRRGDGPISSASVSHDRIMSVHIDPDDTVWIATFYGLDKYDPKEKKFTHYFESEDNKEFPGVRGIYTIYGSGDGILWLGTWDGLIRFDTSNGSFKLYKKPKDNNSDIGLSHNLVRSVCDGADDSLWLATANGLNHFFPKTGTFVHYKHKPGDPNSLSNNNLRVVYRDGNGLLWIAAQDGLNCFDLKTRRFQHIQHQHNNPYSLSQNLILSICESRNGFLWFGTRSRGINKYNPNATLMKLYRDDINQTINLNDNVIYCLMEDRQEKIWIGTRRGGFTTVDPVKKNLNVYKGGPNSSNGLKSNFIKSFLQDSKGTVWVGTELGLHRFNQEEQNFTNYNRQMKHPRYINALDVNTIVEDKGKLWLATFGGLLHFDPETAQIKRYVFDPNKPGSISSSIINCIFLEPQGTLWAGTHRNGLNCFNPGKDDFTVFKYSRHDPGSISDNRITCIFQDTKQRLWVGTAGGGVNLFNPGQGTFKRYTAKEGLTNTIMAMLEDETGQLWISSNNGILRFNPDTGTVKKYRMKDGLQSLEFGNAAIKTRRGEMFFGGTNGLNSFFPNQLKSNSYMPPVFITGFQQFNRDRASNVALKKHISFTSRITLDYDENNFWLQFAALDYSHPDSNKYIYKVEGAGENWNYIGNRNDITLVGLSPGHYTLRVKGSNSDGIWSKQETALEIIIKPPFWATWWFRLLIVMVITALLLRWHQARLKHATLQLQTEATMNRIFSKHKISPREQEILQLVMKGRSNNEIEEELYISLKTVKSHIYKIYRKVGVKNRLELINFFQGNPPPQ